jgi:hypothetical protein
MLERVEVGVPTIDLAVRPPELPPEDTFGKPSLRRHRLLELFRRGDAQGPLPQDFLL